MPAWQPDYSREDPPRRTLAFESLQGYRYKRCLIGIEEHCAVPPGFKDRPSVDHFADLYKFKKEYMKDIGNRLIDVELRVKTMDKCGMAAQLLSLAEPGTQGFTVDELERSKDFARRANDWMHETYCKKYPGRFFGLACLPTQDPRAAAEELDRAITQLGFKGCLINGATPTGKKGGPPNFEDYVYLDGREWDVFWAMVEKHNSFVFLHPRAPPAAYFPLGKDYPGLAAPTWGFTRETQEHVMRIMLSGVFDRFPKARLILGHLGEGLTFSLPRSAHRERIIEQGACGDHKRPLTYYMNNNVKCLTSGHFTSSSLFQVMAEVGHTNVSFSTDYPFESIEEHVDWWRSIGVGEELWNALEWFNLPESIIEQ